MQRKQQQQQGGQRQPQQQRQQKQSGHVFPGGVKDPNWCWDIAFNRHITDEAGFNPFSTAKPVRLMGCIPTQPLPGQLSPASPPPVMVTWVPRQGGAPAGSRLCSRCNQPGNFISQCITLKHMRTSLGLCPSHPCTTVGTPRSVTAVAAIPRAVLLLPCHLLFFQPVLPPSLTVVATGSTTTFDTHLFTVQFEHQGKNACEFRLKSDFFGFGDGDVWVTNPGVPYHMTGDHILMLMDPPPLVDKGILFVGDMKPMEVVF